MNKIMNEKQICNTATNDNQTLDFWQAYTEYGDFKHVSGRPILPHTWENGITVQHKSFF